MNKVRDYIKSNFVINESRKDCICWKVDKKGVFNVSSVWKMMLQDRQRVCWATWCG